MHGRFHSVKPVRGLNEQQPTGIAIPAMIFYESRKKTCTFDFCRPRRPTGIEIATRPDRVGTCEIRKHNLVDARMPVSTAPTVLAATPVAAKAGQTVRAYAIISFTRSQLIASQAERCPSG